MSKGTKEKSNKDIKEAQKIGDNKGNKKKKFMTFKILSRIIY